MKKSLILLILGSLIIITACQNNKMPKQIDDNDLNYAKEQIANYFNYQYNPGELKKLARSENNDIYYYAADGKRYVFPNLDIFKSWFGDYDINKLELQDLQTLYETPLGGNVTLRPGSLMMTETNLDIYLITGDSAMKVIKNFDLLIELYGTNYKDYIITIPNFYFTQYENTGIINQAGDIPSIINNLTIDQDKGFK